MTQPMPVALRPARAVLADWKRALENTSRRRDKPEPLASVVHTAADRYPAKLALLGEDENLTYGELASRSNRYARWALRQGLAPGQVVALLMPNCPDYVAIWIGLTQAGCVVALLNTNLPTPALVHAIRAAAASHLIVAGSLVANARPASTQLPTPIQWWSHGDGKSDLPRIADALARESGGPLTQQEERTPSPRQPALLIYTSGTTGLPKATIVTHARIMGWSDWFAGMMDAHPSDRLFNCLPMYHSVGGVVAIGSMLVAGGSVVIRKRFSARSFWSDIGDTNCTIVQYIGDLCRYLLRSPPHPNETAHQIRLFCGNGLRGDVWQAFQSRFGIPRILEFYAATEGSVSLYNCEAMPGAIGRLPPFLAHRVPIALIRCDPATGRPLRDSNGYCIRCATDEPGEAIGRLDDADSQRQFDGYTDRPATEQKLLHNAFAQGDQWFRTGDLMRRDAAGYFYFIDRLGDTFRWKGENVSTTEVASVLGACPGVIEAAVYGVPIPGADGKAGMAAVVVSQVFNLTVYRAYVHANLPVYARPLFLRICSELETTSTNKLIKTALAREAYQADGKDPIFFDDWMRKAMVPVEAALLQALQSESLRL